MKILTLLVRLAPLLASLFTRHNASEQPTKRAPVAGKNNSWKADADKLLEQLMNAKWGASERPVENDPVEKELADSHRDDGPDRLRSSDGFRRG
ncbi:hypothetical protein [Cohaesibacter haloalkalitolerans]|uniref:hypothetical protein n=1 Tax=Cohaesibacter haloalkalitolerans TaxID=1162980 RepID=UPI0013C3ECCE|nr:hypothetical protein [Cohaesibacter haloalkalitolerans]